ncbi:MAG: phospholipase D-like domain-containing protein [Candidatus Micrarchaeia archaeon]
MVTSERIGSSAVDKSIFFIALLFILTGASFYLGFRLAESEKCQVETIGNIINTGGKYDNGIPSTSAAVSVIPVISPGEDAEDRILELIATANNTIDIEMYIFTNPRLALSLADAERRGVQVRVILGSTEGDDVTDIIAMLKGSGIEVKSAATLFKTMHAKFMVIDGKVILIGSHNWSRSAMDYNREVSIIIYSPAIAQKLSSIFVSDWKDSMSLITT